MVDEAKKTGEDLGLNIYGYERAFKYSPDDEHLEWLNDQAQKLGFRDPSLLDPTAGGGSIPFEGERLGLRVVANDLNPVAWLILKATVEFPFKHGSSLLKRFQQLAKRFRELAEPRFAGVFPPEPPGTNVLGYLWARTVTCPYCGGVVPLSPDWRLNSKGTGVRLIPKTDNPVHRRCKFEIVSKVADQSAGTVNHGSGQCPYPDCGRIFDGNEIKSQAQAGNMGDQLYAVVFEQMVKAGSTKTGKDKFKKSRCFRSPNAFDDVSDVVAAALAAKMPEWQARNIVPDEDIPAGHKTGDEGGEGSGTDKPLKVGMNRWRDMFSPRQLLGHCTSVEVFHDLVDELGRQQDGDIPEIDKAALTYIAISIDKVVHYNAYGPRREPPFLQREY